LENFNVEAEDDSPKEVSVTLVEQFHRCRAGDFSEASRIVGMPVHDLSQCQGDDGSDDEAEDVDGVGMDDGGAGAGAAAAQEPVQLTAEQQADVDAGWAIAGR
jgi:hypothetical protein